MKNILKITMIIILCFPIGGCTTNKKKKENKISNSDAYALLNAKNTIEYIVMPNTDSLLLVNLIFNDSQDTISYLYGAISIFYSSKKIDHTNTIPLYNSIDSYDVIESAPKQDITVLKNFIASIDKNMTTRQFIDWCLYKGKEAVNNFKK